MKRRVKGMGFFGLVLLLALICRLYYIQILCGSALAEGAERQQIIEIQYAGHRGTIYDRNMARLTDCRLSYYYLVANDRYDSGLETLLKKMDAQEAGAKGTEYTVYKTDHFDSEWNQKMTEEYGAYAFCSGSRYAQDQIAAHLIGYVSGEAQTGAAGLENIYQYRLASSPVRMLMWGDGVGSPIRGIGVTETGQKQIVSPASLVTTIDSSLQRQVESILKERNVQGAVIVLQSGTGQVLAMASSPTFDPNQIDAYLQSENGELINKALQGQYPPGSVFKIVVAAAALESGKVDPKKTYECSGSTMVNGVTMICEEHPDGHGTVDMETAFAGSCNCYFAQVAKEIGSETIIDMAQRMGLGRTVLDRFSEEEEGAFPEKSERFYSGLANLAVGQGSLLVTPIQIARLTNIIAAGGVDYGLTVVMGQKSENSPRRVMSKVTAAKVGKMMELVCTQGTASSADFHVKAAGKTGSAETGEDGTYTVHGWFAGYFPADRPEYTVIVLAEDGKTGSSSALPVFERIMNFLY